MKGALRILLAGALFCAMGGHLVVLQAYAWATMAAKGRAVDGSDPCDICLKVKRSAGGELGVAAPVRTVRASLAAPRRSSWKSVAGVTAFEPSAPSVPDSAVNPPSTPPPRSLPS